MRLQSDGFRIGVLKALGDSPIKTGRRSVDTDARFIQGLLTLPDSPETICPVTMTPEIERKARRGK
jgi:hypothetical protein